jgi:phenylalanyl-tRNA synthetase alpha chain
MYIDEALRILAKEARGLVPMISTLESLEEARTNFLGRKGQLAELMKKMAEATAEERPALGAMANDIKIELEGLFSEVESRLKREALNASLASEAEDITEPGIMPAQGHVHVMNQAMDEIEQIFTKAGFTRVRYPEVEWDDFAFERLNMPKDHPARDEWETFFMDAPVHPQFGKMLLTPHATSGTARILNEKQLPIRAINIAKTYRRQSSVRHLSMFHQFDGVFVDKNVSITHLRGLFDYFIHEFFGPERKTRYRPYHFRFTEPSFEIDISCAVCNGTGKLKDESKCRICKHGWLELGGAGMLHPNVLKAAGIDPDEYSGLAFGWGIERTYMMKEGLNLDDIRTLYKNDIRFLEQF